MSKNNNETRTKKVTKEEKKQAIEKAAPYIFRAIQFYTVNMHKLMHTKGKNHVDAVRALIYDCKQLFILTLTDSPSVTLIKASYAEIVKKRRQVLLFESPEKVQDGGDDTEIRLTDAETEILMDAYVAAQAYSDAEKQKRQPYATQDLIDAYGSVEQHCEHLFSATIKMPLPLNQIANFSIGIEEAYKKAEQLHMKLKSQKQTATVSA